MSTLRSGSPRRLNRLTSLALIAVLLAAALACNLPVSGSGDPINDALATAARQTAAAQFAAATVTAALAQSAGATQTVLVAGDPALTQAAQATNAAQATTQAQSAAATAAAAGQAAQLTAQANSAQATQAVLSSAATAQAQSAQATALWLAATQTAMAWQPQPPQPPPPYPPQPPPNRNVTPIRFQTGATSAYVEGGLSKNAAIDYSVSASQGQWLLVDVSSPDNNVGLGISGMQNGVVLLPPGQGATHFQGLLPATQAYRLTLTAPAQQTTYALNVIIPARIQFRPGATGASIPGSIGPNQANYYTAWANAGQTMSVNIASPASSVLLTIYGLQDGQPLVRSASGATSWTGVLPAAQDYMIIAVSSGPAANYTLDLTIR